MKKVLVLLHPGFEEIEAITSVDLLRRAGITVTTASVTKDLKVLGSRNMTLMADTLLSTCVDQVFDMLLIPGGPGVDALRMRPEVLELVRKFRNEQAYIAAICAAPLVLMDAGITSNLAVTSFPGSEEELTGHVRSYVEDRVHIDGKVITSRGAGTSEEFALTLISLLLNPEAAEQVRQRIVAR